jgi:hypothetical protein
MTEPDVTLTDFAIAVQGIAMAVFLARRQERSKGTLAWSLYFASAGLAAFFGGVVHGFYLDLHSGGHAIVWPLSLTAIGVNAIAAWAIGATLVLSPAANRRLIFWAGSLFVAYCGYVWLVDGRFVVAIVMSAPATLFLLAALVVASCRGCRGAGVAAFGVFLTLVAVAVQYFEIAIDPFRFNHNATAHVVQMASLALVFAGSLRMLKPSHSFATEKSQCSPDAIS